MSEWCLLPGAHKKNIEGFTKDWHCSNYADMQAGLLMARIIYSDMVDSNTASWSYWKGMELDGNHALVALYAKEDDIFRGGDVKANKLLYVLGNYSFFVRPNYTRVELSGADNLSEVAATAYLSPDGKRLVAVYVNNTFEKKTVEVALPKACKIASAKMYVTDERNDLSAHEMVKAFSFSLNARSVTTVVYNLK
jgi:O-glycosyl hydrolase